MTCVAVKALIERNSANVYIYIAIHLHSYTYFLTKVKKYSLYLNRPRTITMVQNMQLNFYKNIWECFERNWGYVTCAKNSCALHQSEAITKNHGSLCEKSP